MSGAHWDSQARRLVNISIPRRTRNRPLMMVTTRIALPPGSRKPGVPSNNAPGFLTRRKESLYHPVYHNLCATTSAIWPGQAWAKWPMCHIFVVGNIGRLIVGGNWTIHVFSGAVDRVQTHRIECFGAGVSIVLILTWPKPSSTLQRYSHCRTSAARGPDGQSREDPRSALVPGCRRRKRGVRQPG